jgi:HEAT repeat protein
LTPEQRQAAIDAETDRLQDWSLSDDPGVLPNILADLSNPEKEVREAAIEATKQFGSSNAIPTLRAAVANTTDPEEQIALLEAVEFLSLPGISDSSVQLPRTPEQIQADQQRILQRQAQRQKNAPNRNSQPPPNN